MSSVFECGHSWEENREETKVLSRKFAPSAVRIINKDHQRMTVDPMLLIFHNFRLFLTAPTLYFTTLHCTAI